jgi:hypothetical protein
MKGLEAKYEPLSIPTDQPLGSTPKFDPNHRPALRTALASTTQPLVASPALTSLCQECQIQLIYRIFLIGPCLAPKPQNRLAEPCSAIGYRAIGYRAPPAAASALRTPTIYVTGFLELCINKEGAGGAEKQ